MIQWQNGSLKQGNPSNLQPSKREKKGGMKMPSYYYIVVIACLVVSICLWAYSVFGHKKHEIKRIREFLDKYGYDDKDNEQIANEIYLELQRNTRKGMSYQEFCRIADVITNPHLDPKKTQPTQSTPDE